MLTRLLLPFIQRKEFSRMTDRELRAVVTYGSTDAGIRAAEELRLRKVATMRPEDFAPIPRRFVS
jgi:hypothetical protein